MEKELTGGRPDVEEMLDDEQVPEDEPLLEFPDDEIEEDQQQSGDGGASALDDLPAQLRREKRDAETSVKPTPPKKLRFEEAKEQTAAQMKHMKEVMKKYEPGAPGRNEQQGGATSSTAPPPSAPTPPPQQASHRGHGVFHSSREVHGLLHVQRVYHLRNATRSQRKMLLAAKRNGWSTYVAEVLDVTNEVEGVVKDESHETPNPAEDLVTGKPRLEFRWKDLDEEWRSAFENPIKKAVDVYIDNQALRPVPQGQLVPPMKVLPSRFVLTNKGKDTLEEAELKARWVLAGHLDKEAGQYATEAPTANLISHNVICFLSAHLKWKMRYADISAAFLQGEFLEETREVYVKFPRGYPDSVTAHLRQRLAGLTKGTIREDLVQLVKGGFGLAESPRLWYLRLQRGLESLGLLAPGTFTFHVRGHFRGVLAVHVDDIRMAFHPLFEHLLDKLKDLFKFGEWQDAMSKKVKFCGRWESQDPKTFKVTVTMDGYAPKLRDPPQRESQDRTPLTDAERKWVSSVGGQLNWMACQGRADLAFGISKVQQMSGARDPETMKALGQLVRKAKEPYEYVFQEIDGEIDNMVFLGVSDASHGAMPKGRSQGGLMVLVADEKILDGEAVVNCLMFHSSVIKRVVRSSLAAEVSQAAETMEQTDYVRAMFAEMVDPEFSLSEWRWSAGKWREILVLDSKTGYDVLNGISNGEDKRLAIDVAILKEALYEPGSNKWLRWVPGLTIPADGLTKEYGNAMRDLVLRGGPWSLKDSPAAQKLREEAGHRKRQCKLRLKAKECLAEDVRLQLQRGQV